MMAEFLQFLFSGLTAGSTYALAALGFVIIYNASGVINFAQGEFIMLGGMVAVFLVKLGAPLPLAIVGSLALAALAGYLMARLTIEPARNADVVQLIIITIGGALILRGLVQVYLGKNSHVLPAFSDDGPIRILGATILPQTLWALALTALLVCGLAWLFKGTRTGRAMLANACDKLAAQLVGIDTRAVLRMSFVLAALLGAVGGVLTAPIFPTSFEAGVMLGLKGFVAAILGGLGSATGAIVGGLILGVAEAMTAGYISSAYKDAMPFVLILVLLCFMPRGLFGAKVSERV